jgi:hypothetical protein
MRAHIIENGVVVNTILVDSLDFMPNLVEATEGSIGWSYANGVFTAPPVQIIPEAAQPTKEELLIELQALTEKINSLS